MKILWFPRIQPDVVKLHLTTWREMCRELELLGCTVKIAVTGRDNENILNKECIKVFLIKIKYLRILSFWIDGFVKFLYNYFIFKPDAVILDTFSVWFSIPFLFSSSRKIVFIVDNRTPHYNLASNRDTFRDKIMKFYTKLCYLYSRCFLDGMTVITDYYRDYIYNSFKYPFPLIGVWSSGVNTENFFSNGYKDANKPLFLKNKFILMQHGDFSSNRGILETIEAINLIEKKDICLVLIGEGKARKEIFQKIKRLRLSQRVYVLPPVPHSEIPAYISYCDCAVMAYPNMEYWKNNNPIKFLEYLAMGKVVICTDMWTFNNIAGGRKCVHYIKNNSPEKIADAINYCYDNKEFLDDWGRDGVEIVKEKYTWRNQAKILLDFIKQLKK